MKRWKRWMTVFAAVLLLTGMQPSQVFASDLKITSDKITRGKTGKSVTVSFKVENTSGTNIEELVVFFDTNAGEIWDEDEEDMKYGYSFPFEVTGSLNDSEHPKGAGKLSARSSKTVSLTGRVRNDLTEGYYKVPVVAEDRRTGDRSYQDLQIWISRSASSDDDDDDENNTYDFVLGEQQNTPDGTYPHVMNFSMNLRNNSPAAVYNVKASMTLDPDSKKFPFEINDANYDRMFDKIDVDETVQLGYSFAIRPDVYSGYYPIAMKIYYSKSSTGDELQTFETSFYVRVHNKEKEDEYGEFNEHDRTRARIIVDGFQTEPETIIAGDSFDLILQMKNASSNVPAANILFSMESEKVSDSAVFTTESGSSSIALDSLGAGATKEIRLRLSSKAGADQRSYGLTVKAKYDSPEFKNAEESMIIDIPVRQIPRLNTGTFEVMPDSVTVGGESNITFGINNTGKVLLYNVMVKFEGDSIQTTDTYVGNIKPGETGNVDCMVTGTAPTADEGKIKAIISYEDENGQVSEEEKEVTLFVTEDMSYMEDMDAGNMDDMRIEESSGQQKYKKILLPMFICLAVVIGITIFAFVSKRRKKKRAHEEMDEIDDHEEE